MKKLVSLLMVLAMLLSCTAMAETATTEGEWHDRWLPTYTYSGETKLPEYMNTESYWPIVKEGHEVTLKLGIVYADTKTEPAKIEEMWLFKFLNKFTGINFEYDFIPASALEQRKALVFLEELPDILLGYALTPNELVTYGDVDGQLLNMVPYINSDICPAITLQMQDANVRQSVTTTTGAMYTLPRVYSSLDTHAYGNAEAMYVNTEWLAEIGLEKAPTTLNDFTAMLYAFKEKHPDGIPLFASDASADVRTYVYNALGFLTSTGNDTGSGPALRNGEVVIPAYTPEFKEALKVLNEWYVNGLIPQDYFSLDATAADAMVTEWNWGATNKDSLGGFLPGGTEEEKQNAMWKIWTGYPLTSDWNDTQAIPSYSLCSKIGGVAISAETEHPELCMRLCDFYFTELGTVYMHEGPANGSPDTLGMTDGHTVTPDWKITYHDNVNNRWNGASYTHMVTGPNGQLFGHRAASLYRPEEITYFRQISIEMSGYEPSPYTLLKENSDNWFKMAKIEGFFPYLVNGYPTYTYMTEDVALELADLKSVIDPYIDGEVAKFITGLNSLDNFDKFISDLEAMGIKDMLKIYTDLYVPAE